MANALNAKCCISFCFKFRKQQSSYTILSVVYVACNALARHHKSPIFFGMIYKHTSLEGDMWDIVHIR